MSKNKLGEWPIKKLIWNLSIPLMISMLVQSLYNIVDSMFVSAINQNALTATSIAYPMQMLMLSVAIGTGVGINSYLSRTLGKKDYKNANKVATTSLILAIITSIVFILIGIFFVKSFILLFTHEKQISEYGISYLRICLIGCTGIFLGTTGERLLQATGNTKLSMKAQVLGAVINLILDPLFIFTFKLGIQGAAIATILGQWVAAVYALYLNHTKNKEITFEFTDFHFDSVMIKDIYIVGIPTMIMQTMGSLMMLSINALLASTSLVAVSVFGIYHKLQSFVFMPVSGLAQGLLPIAGYNFGAKNGKRVMEAYKITLLYALIFMAIGTLLFECFPNLLLTLYHANSEMMLIGENALRVLAIPFILTAITTTTGFLASSLGNGIVSMIGTALRQLVIPIPIVMFLLKVTNLYQIWIAFPIGEILAVIYILFKMKQEYTKKIIPILDN